MLAKKYSLFGISVLLVFIAGCSVIGDAGKTSPQTSGFAPNEPSNLIQSTIAVTPTSADMQATYSPVLTQASPTLTQTISPTTTSTSTPTETEVVFQVGQELTIDYLQNLEITGSEITFEQQLTDRSNYHQHIVSYISEGNKIYGLLTIPFAEPPQGGYKAIIFNHGYIPPAAYRTTERYTAYVDHLASSGFVVFKIDYRGHGESEGEPTGSYFSPGYTIDAISALKSLQTLDIIDPQGIGMWGHSMAGNLVLRAMLIEPDIQAGVIWSGAVYSYTDFEQYRINDNTYRPPATPENQDASDRRSGSRMIFDTYGRPNAQTDFWKAVSLTENIESLDRPLQLHHAQDDTVVNIGYSIDLASVLQENGKQYEFYSYEGGGHNLTSPYFNLAIQRTVAFFLDNL